jgi:hypothetical protein
MIQSFNSWSQINEAIASGSEKYLNTSTGKKVKITYKVQSPTKFIMKLINYDDVISGNLLTQEGINAITSFLNGEPAFTREIGQFTEIFFSDKFIVYKIMADGSILGRTKQKIQFTIEKRLDGNGQPLHPGVTAATKFIDSESFEALSKLAPQVIQQIVNTAQSTQLEDPTPDTQEVPTNTETAPLKGKKFQYTMRTNSKLYLMEFTETGNLKARTKDRSKPDGEVAYSKAESKVLWNTDLDDAVSKDAKLSKELNAPLFHDMEITNTYDKDFFTKIFTDPTFRDKIIKEYEGEGGGINAESIKNFLYYKNGNPIFGDSPTPPGVEGGSETDPAKISAITQQLQAVQQKWQQSAQK